MRLLGSRFRRSLAISLSLAISATSVGCSSTGDGTDPTDDVGLTVSGPGYEYELASVGQGERFELVAPIPVGRSALVTVGMASHGEAVEVDLVVEVRSADAGGVGQEIELRVVEVRSDDPHTVDSLDQILDASSIVRRDARRAVVEQVLDIPAGLGFRADAVARQVLRAPFSLVGPLALVPVGVGARWTVRDTDDGIVVDEREVTVSEIDESGHVLTFAVPDGAVEIHGRVDALLPDLQIITVSDAELTVTAART